LNRSGSKGIESIFELGLERGCQSKLVVVAGAGSIARAASKDGGAAAGAALAPAFGA
jgi:hypothetical protein